MPPRFGGIVASHLRQANLDPAREVSERLVKANSRRPFPAIQAPGAGASTGGIPTAYISAKRAEHPLVRISRSARGLAFTNSQRTRACRLGTVGHQPIVTAAGSRRQHN